MGAHERLLAGRGRLLRLSQLPVLQLPVLLPPLDRWLELLTNWLEFLALMVLEVSSMSAVDTVVDLKRWGVPSAVASAVADLE